MHCGYNRYHPAIGRLRAPSTVNLQWSHGSIETIFRFSMRYDVEEIWCNSKQWRKGRCSGVRIWAGFAASVDGSSRRICLPSLLLE